MSEYGVCALITKPFILLHVPENGLEEVNSALRFRALVWIMKMRVEDRGLKVRARLMYFLIVCI